MSLLKSNHDYNAIHFDFFFFFMVVFEQTQHKRNMNGIIIKKHACVSGQVWFFMNCKHILN